MTAMKIDKAVNRLISDESSREALIRFITHHAMPFTITVSPGKLRSVEQNRLQRLWIKEVADQMGDRTPEEVRGYCKLTFGVPILLEENEAFREVYEKVIQPLTYEQRMMIMMVPLDLPVTRFMNVKQKTRYLDQVHKHFSELGIELTDPSPLTT